MSFVGPRPALYNQNDLIDLRTKIKFIYMFRGLTGWAQINGRDELSISEKLSWMSIISRAFHLNLIL